VGGTDPESIDAMRQSIPRAAIRLKSRAITLNDYADLALQVPGVSKSMAHGTVYTSVHVRIAPIKGQADDTLMDDLCDRVERYLEDKIIVGSAVMIEPRSPGAIDQLWQDVYVYLMVHVQDSYNRTTVRHNVEAAIRQMMAFDAVDFETRISIGTIYRMALSIQGVEWVDLIWLNGVSPVAGGTATVTNKALTTNVATLTVGLHAFRVGQQVRVVGVDTVFDGYWTLTAITSTTVSYARISTDVATAASGGSVSSQSINIWTDDDQRQIGDIETPPQLIPRIVPSKALLTADVSYKAITTGFVATLTTLGDHGLLVGDTVLVTGVGAPFDGRWEGIAVPDGSHISYNLPGSPALVTVTAATGTIAQQDPFAPEDETDFPTMTEEERTHDGLWVQAMGGLPGT
jgi:hypothetical protein